MEPFEAKPVKDCYHVFSDGTRVLVLCDAEDDYVYMMNQIAVAAFFCDLSILALEVMRTHFHVVVRGSREKVYKFKVQVKRLIARRYNRAGLSRLVKNSLDIRMDEITTDEELRRKIIYVLRNCTEAGFDYLPEDYPWGPGYIYCRPDRNEYRRVSELDYREQCRFFKTRVKLPADWEYDGKMMLVPSSYIDKEYISRNVFFSPRQFIAFLNVRKKDLAEMEAADARPFLEKRDESALLKEVESAAVKRYGKTVLQLNKTQRLELAIPFWAEGKTTSIKQLARLTRTNVDLLRTVLHVEKADQSSSKYRVQKS